MFRLIATQVLIGSTCFAQTIAMTKPTWLPVFPGVVATNQSQASATQKIAPAATENEKVRERLVILADRSESMDGFNPPETTQSAILHLLELAALADRDLEVLVITFGSEVKSFGGSDGSPTVAYQSLARKLVADWPKPAGSTPLDIALERAVNASKDADKVPTTVIMFSDGEAQSGWLRPDVFPEVKQAMIKMETALRDAFSGEDAAIQAEKLRRFQLKLNDRDSSERKKLYFDTQLPAEQAKALEHVKSLQGQSVRFVTIAFTELAKVKELHQAAGGVPQDYIETTPDQVIAELQQHGIANLRGVVQLDTVELAAAPSDFEVKFSIKTAPLGDGVYVPIAFHPAIPDFETDCQLTITADGQPYVVDVQNPAPETVVTRDASGSVSTISIRLPFVPQNHTLQFHWESPNGARTVPKLSAYPFLKLREDVLADFRPVHLPLDHIAPFSVSANGPTVWRFVVRTSDNSQTFDLATAEAVLRSGERTERLALALSPDTPGSVVSKPLQLPLGTWDVELHAETKTGIPIHLTLARHIQSVLKDEAILISLPQASESDREVVSDSPSHLDFGQVGDAILKRSLEFELSTSEFETPVNVVIDAELADADRNIPTGDWIRFNRTQLTLVPGRSQRLRVTLTVPKHVGSTIVDGPMEGRFRVRITDSGYVLPVRRAEPIAGVPDDAPADRITCELKRPVTTLAMPWALRNWIKPSGDAGAKARIRVDINQPFSRTVTLEVSTDSEIEREVTVFPSPTLTDPTGRSVPGMRLVPVSDNANTQTLSPGSTGRWEFTFEIDPDCDVRKAQAFFDIHGDGIVSQHVTIELLRRNQLMAKRLASLGWMVGCVLLALIFITWLKRRGIKRLVTSAHSLLTLTRPIRGLLSVSSPSAGRLVLTPQVPMQVGTGQGLKRARRVGPGQPYPLRVDASEGQPELRLGDGEDQTVLSIVDVRFDEANKPVIELEVSDGGAFDFQASSLMKRIVLLGLLATACATVAFGTDNPRIIYVLQWLRDFIVGS